MMCSNYNTPPDISILYSNVKSGDGKRLTPKRATEKWLSSNDPTLLKEILEFTSNEPDVNLITRIKMVEKKMHVLPLCKTCKTKKVSSINIEYCSNSCAIKSPHAQEKTKNTCNEKYGKRFNINYNKTYNLGEHHTQKNITNINDINDKEFMQNLIKTGWKSVAKHFSLTEKSHSSTYNFLRKHGYEPILVSGFSTQEKELVEFIKNELGVANVVENSKKIIAPYELDIYAPDHSLAIEYNGLFYHSFDHKETKSEATYHKMKTEKCEELGLSLVHIFENEWLYSKDIVKSLLRNKFGLNKVVLNARDCDIIVLNGTQFREFCNLNHMQGYCQSKLKLGLYHKKLKQIVSVMSFSMPRFQKQKENTVEIIRFASLKNTSVRGAFNKLLRYFEKENPTIKTILSFGNRRWCSIANNVYEKNGFVLEHITAPNYFYYDKNFEIYSRNEFQKHKLKTKLSLYDETKTESELMFMNGYRRFWDSGSLKYRKELR